MKRNLSYVEANILDADNQFRNEKRFSFSQSLHDTISNYTIGVNLLS